MTASATPSISLHTRLLASEAATDALAAVLANLATPGLVILLDGPVGAGKTALARRVIQDLQARHGTPEDVPSPTFTIVQTYEARLAADDADPLEIWHADLYRLTSTSELSELGLDAAFETALCLVEWPDRLGTSRPDALTISLAQGAEDTARIATFSATGRAVPILEELMQGLPA